MNLHTFTARNGLRVEAEPKEITIRIWTPENAHLFNCQVTAAGMSLARITAGTIMPGMQFDARIHHAMNDYLISQGFTHGMIEREDVDPSDKFRIITRKLKT
jgi:hypothetical protein